MENAKELGIDLSSGKEEEIFKWFIAAQLFGGHISARIAMKTYFKFQEARVLSVDELLKMGHQAMIQVMAEGHYVRYDESKTRQLVGNCRLLKRKYEGKVGNIHRFAENSKDLGVRLREFKGFGPVTRDIFLRELKPIWAKSVHIPELEPTN